MLLTLVPIALIAVLVGLYLALRTWRRKNGTTFTLLSCCWDEKRRWRLRQVSNAVVPVRDAAAVLLYCCMKTGCVFHLHSKAIVGCTETAVS